MAKTFTLTNPAASGVTIRNGVWFPSVAASTPGFWSFTAADTGIWAPLSGTYQSFWTEADLQFSSVVLPGNLFIKAGTFALKIGATGKLYLDSVTSQSDVAAGYSLSADKEEGNTTLKPGIRYKIRFEYDHATAMVRVLLNGYEEIRFYRIRQPSAINMTKDKLTCFEKMTGFVLYSLTVGNDRPAYRGMRLVAKRSRGFSILYIERCDPELLGKTFRVFLESPYGVIIQEHTGQTGGHIDSPTIQSKVLLETDSAIAGTYSVTVQCGTFQQTLLIQSGYEPEMPKEFFTGFYNVRNGDMALAKANGATTTDSDWVQQRTVPIGVPNTPQNRLRMYADAAQAAGMGLISVCNIHNGKDECLLPEFANHPGIHSLILGDELYGNTNRFVESFHSIRTQTKKPVWGSLNKPNLIPQMSMCSNGIVLNIYGTGTDIVKKINELATYAARWDCPVIVCIASYGNVPSSATDLTNQIAACKGHPNIIGCLVFEWSHQETAGGPGWYLPQHPELLQAVKNGFNG